MPKRLTQEIDLDTGVVVKETYLVGQILHRDPSEGPAVIERDPATGNITREEYYVNNQNHREDGPAVLVHVYGPRRVLEIYCIKGRSRHPAKGPAILFRNLETGIVQKEEYLLNHRLHRDPAKGPAFIYRDPITGDVRRREYRLFGKLIPEPQRGETPGRRRSSRTPAP